MSTQNTIYLASKSPRRRELLNQIGVQYQLLLLREAPPRGPDVTEIVLPGEAADHYVARVTREKAEKAWQVMQLRSLPTRPVLAADTTVVVDQQILGKPADPQEAAAMMRLLSGRTHQVFTSLALATETGLLCSTQISQVSFSTLDEAQILGYCASREPYDKAGGYGIQGAAARYICHIEGSYSGIMGLPLFETCQLLRQAGIAIA